MYNKNVKRNNNQNNNNIQYLYVIKNNSINNSVNNSVNKNNNVMVNDIYITCVKNSNMV